MGSKISSIAKTSQLSKNNSENALYKDQKTRNYFNLIKNWSKGAIPQTARYEQTQMPSMIESLKLKPQSSCIVSPQKQWLENDHDNILNNQNNWITSSSYSNIFKQRRTTQNFHNERENKNDKITKVKHTVGQRYFYQK